MSKPMMRVVREPAAALAHGDDGIWFRTYYFDPKDERATETALAEVAADVHYGRGARRMAAIRLAALLSRETESEEPCVPHAGDGLDGYRCRLHKGHAGPFLPERRVKERREGERRAKVRRQRSQPVTYPVGDRRQSTSRRMWWLEGRRSGNDRRKYKEGP